MNVTDLHRSAKGGVKISAGLRAAWRAGYRLADLKADLLAGLVVGVVALPLSMALAIACNAPPQHGLFTAVVAGLVIALTGGSSVQVSGPTAAFVAILAPVTMKFGVQGLMLASMLAGVILIVMAIGGMGRLIEYIPYPVTTGFTAGIAVVIATMQLRDFFGLTIADPSPHALERWRQMFEAAGTLRWNELLVGGLTLTMLLVVPRFIEAVPAPLIALLVASGVGLLLERGGYGVATIQSRFGDIPSMLPAPSMPWLFADGVPAPSLGDLIGPAFAIAMLGAIESLLSAVIADGMTGKRHDPDAELLGQGIGNVVAPFFGGFAATGAIARTATGIRAGSRSPLAAVFHALFVLLAMVAFAPWLGYLPMAALAAQLLITAWNMSEVRHVVRMARIAPRADVMVLGLCITLTVAFDMVIAVGVGVVAAALLFMRRMADLATVELVGDEHPERPPDLPPGVAIYRINGPLFFGAAQRAVGALQTVGLSAKAVLLDLRDVPHLDATGLANLESALNALHRARVFVIVAGVQKDPLQLMARAGWKHRPWMTVLRSFDEGLTLARTLAPSDFEALTEPAHTVQHAHRPH